jgi:hypothetical protein
MAVRIQLLAYISILFLVPPALQAEGIFSKGGPDAGTPEYYEYYSNLPVGARQVYYKGKLWPPRPRPVGPPQPCAHKYHAATFWPWPYVCQDRMLVQATTHTQIENGWIAATTFYDYHFDAETHALNSAGRRHLEYLLIHVPEEFRKAYVSSTFAPQQSDARVASVQAEIASLLGDAHSVPIELRAAEPLQRNAIVVEQIHRGGIEHMPVPTIKYQDVSSN